MKRQLRFLILIAALVGACSPGPSYTVGPVEASEGDMRVRVVTDPAPPRVGESAMLTISVLDARSGTPLEAVEIRPVVDMTMATSRMLLPFEVLDTTEQGQVTIQVIPEHAGTLKISVGVKRDGLITSIRVPDIPVQP